MRIRCLMDFKEGRDAFHKDDLRAVDDAVGARLIKNGWAVADGSQPRSVEAPASVTLDIHDARMSVKDSGRG